MKVEQGKVGYRADAEPPCAGFGGRRWRGVELRGRVGPIPVIRARVESLGVQLGVPREGAAFSAVPGGCGRGAAFKECLTESGLIHTLSRLSLPLYGSRVYGFCSDRVPGGVGVSANGCQCQTVLWSEMRMNGCYR